MPTTFQKRQKEMKRIEKRKMKEEKRAERKLEKTAQKESGVQDDGVDYNFERMPPELETGE